MSGSRSQKIIFPLKRLFLFCFFCLGLIVNTPLELLHIVSGSLQCIICSIYTELWMECVCQWKTHFRLGSFASLLTSILHQLFFIGNLKATGSWKEDTAMGNSRLQQARSLSAFITLTSWWMSGSFYPLKLCVGLKEYKREIFCCSMVPTNAKSHKFFRLLFGDNCFLYNGFIRAFLGGRWTTTCCLWKWGCWEQFYWTTTQAGSHQNSGLIMVKCSLRLETRFIICSNLYLCEYKTSG